MTSKPLDPVRPSLKSGLGHWWHQRLSAIVLVPLSLWLIIVLATSEHGSAGQWVAWLQNPLHSLGVGITLLAGLYHGKLGVEVVIEDYVSTVRTRLILIMILNAVMGVLGFASVGALLVILSRAVA